MLKYAIVRFKDAKYIRIHSLFEFEHVCFQILGAFVLAWIVMRVAGTALKDASTSGHAALSEKA